MTHDEQRLFLISELIGERGDRITVPEDEQGQKDLLRSLMNVRSPGKLSERYIEFEAEYLKHEAEEKGIIRLSDLTPIKDDLYLWKGDITRLGCDAIVNAANSGLLGCFQPLHKCIDNCIHSAAGLRLRNACYDIMRRQGHEEPTGQAKITPAYSLPCKYVIHTVGPIVYGGLKDSHKRLLESCYRSCLTLAGEQGIGSIAFCCISTGVFGFPKREAAEIAVKTVRSYKLERESGIQVVFNVFSDEDYLIYKNLI